MSDKSDSIRLAREHARKRRRSWTFHTLVHEFGMKPSEALGLMRMAQEAGRAAGRAALSREQKP